MVGLLCVGGALLTSVERECSEGALCRENGRARNPCVGRAESERREAMQTQDHASGAVAKCKHRIGCSKRGPRAQREGGALDHACSHDRTLTLHKA